MFFKFAFIAAALLAISTPALCVESTALGGDLFDNGKKLSVEEVKAIIVGDVEVEQINGSTGGIRHWNNNSDGKFVASRVAATGPSRPVTGQGEWKLTDNGQY